MATDLDRLIVQLSADIRKYSKQMAKAQGIGAKTFNKMGKDVKRFDRVLDRVGTGLSRNLLRTGAVLATAFSVREIKLYADAWTQAGNKIRASSQVAGRAGRSLEGIIELANASRTGLTETSDLYSKLLRATKDVAKSELEVAKATLIVNKAFKAGGAALSEQRAGILQLSQALGSGLLQGDELRSVRENAPLLAQALAKEFNTSIAGLKKLGADGELAIDRVFSAILKAQPEIEAAFGKTNATIADSFVRINNAFTQYIGQADASGGISRQLVNGLNDLADSFDTTADFAIKFAAIIAAGVLGRSLGIMLQSLTLNTIELARFSKGLLKARSLAAAGTVLGGVGIGAVGPIAGLAAIAAASLFLFTRSQDDAGDSSEVAARKASLYAKALGEIKSEADEARRAVDEFNNAGFERQLKVAVETEESVGTELEKAVAVTKKLLNDLADDLERISDLRERNEGDPIEISVLRRQVGELRKFADALVGTTESADELERQINKFSRLNPGFSELATDASVLTDEVDKQARAFVDASDAVRQYLKQVQDLVAFVDPFSDKLFELDLNKPVDRRDDLKAKRLEAAGQSASEKQIQAQIVKVQKDFEKAAKLAKEAGEGFLELRPDEARAQAIRELAIQSLAKLTDAQLKAATSLIQKNEGAPSLTPFRDTDEFGNPDELRIGFSSDTVTLLTEAGNEIVQKVVAGMVITLADVDRDFARRLREGRAEIEGQIGTERFDALTANQQAVLSDLETLYGTLPDRIVKALIEGDAGDVANAIRSFNQPGNVNNRRRNENAEIFTGDASIEIQVRQERISLVKGLITALAEQNEQIRLETGLVGKSNAARESENLRLELRNALTAEGIPLNKENLALIEREVALRFQSVTALDAATDANKRLEDAQEELARVQQQIAGAFQGALKGFISDLVAGKTATEALSNAVGRLADRLLDIALNQIFASLFGAAGGLQGGGGFLAFLSAKDGGQVRRMSPGGLIRGPGGPRDDQVPIMASDKEFIVNARATQANRGLLEAINSGKVKSFADGGFIGSRKPGLVSGSGMTGSAPAPIVSTQVINRFDSASFLSEALASPEGQRVILNDVSARPDAYRSALGI